MWQQSFFLFCFLNNFYFLKLINFSWRISTLQYCDGFCHTSAWIGLRYTCVPPHPEPPPPPSPRCPSELSQSTGFGALLHALNLHWLSVFHMVMYMFQCCSLSQIIPHSPSPTESKSLFFTLVSLLSQHFSFFPPFELEYIGELLLPCWCFVFFFLFLLPQLVSLLLIHKCVYILGFFYIGYYRVWSKFHCVIQWVLVIYFINSVRHILVWSYSLLHAPHLYIFVTGNF